MHCYKSVTNFGEIFACLWTKNVVYWLYKQIFLSTYLFRYIMPLIKEVNCV